MRIALAQYPIREFSSFEDWAAHLRGFVGEAEQAGAALAVLPEYGSLAATSCLGPDIRGDLARSLEALDQLGPAIDATYRELAAGTGLHILAASRPSRREDGRFVNIASLFTPKGRVGVQEKIVMTRFEAEAWGVSGGGPVRVFDTALGRIGVSICFDVEFADIARAQAEAGVWLILAPSCTDTRAGAFRVEVGARARALENQCYVAVSPTVGEAPWLPAVDVNVGWAGLYGPPDLGFPEDGVVARGEAEAPGWVFADAEPERVAAVRERGQVLNFKRRAEARLSAVEPAEIVPLT